jgi:hypothetical protein
VYWVLPAIMWQAVGTERRLRFIWGSHGLNGHTATSAIYVNMLHIPPNYWHNYTTTGSYPQKTVSLISVFPTHVPCLSMHLVKQFETILISWIKMFQLGPITFLHYLSP